MFLPSFLSIWGKVFLEGKAKPPLLVPTIWNHSGLWQFSLHILQRCFSIPTHQHTHVLLRAWQRGVFSPSLCWSAFSSSHISNRPVWINRSQCTHLLSTFSGVQNLFSLASQTQSVQTPSFLTPHSTVILSISISESILSPSP